MSAAVNRGHSTVVNSIEPLDQQPQRLSVHQQPLELAAAVLVAEF